MQLILLGLGTYALRLSFIYLNSLVEKFSTRIKQVLEYLPAAILAALIFPELFSIQSLGWNTIINDSVIAAGVASITSWYTKNMITTIVIGILVLWVLKFIF
jgi:branched-subunit amino acid transport protein